MSSETDQDNVFQRVEGVYFPTPQHLATRVSAHFADRTRAKRKLRIWQLLAVCQGAAFVLFLAFWTVQNSERKVLTAAVGEPYMVYVPLTGDWRPQLDRVEISLPEGMKFYSKKFPGIQEKRTLTLSLNSLRDSQNLPFAITSEIKGKHAVSLRFFDQNGKVLEERSLNIRFHSEKERS
jgi:hypothetical protein